MGVEEKQQIAVLGEVMARWSCGDSVELRWLGGVAVARWSFSGALPRLAWPRRRPVVEKELVGWGIEVPGLP